MAALLEVRGLKAFYGQTQAIYDILGALSRAGLARRIEPAGSPARFEARVGDNHHHIVCRGCGAFHAPSPIVLRHQNPFGGIPCSLLSVAFRFIRRFLRRRCELSFLESSIGDLS